MQMCFAPTHKRWTLKMEEGSNVTHPHPSLATWEQVCSGPPPPWGGGGGSRYFAFLLPAQLSCVGLGPRHYTVHLRAVLLLEFLEHLDKLMYNAYEGTCVTLPTVPKVRGHGLFPTPHVLRNMAKTFTFYLD